jgi:hypothetical protein
MHSELRNQFKMVTTKLDRP